MRTPGIARALAVTVLLAMSASAHAKVFKGLIERRALNDPTVKSSKTIEVHFPNHLAKASRSAKKKAAKKHPPMARQIRETRVLKIKASEIRGSATKKEGAK